MRASLLADFGSTFTKLTLIDLDSAEVAAKAKAPTTVKTEIMEGFREAYTKIEAQMRGIPVEFANKLACSSAAGGLKMVAVGLVPDLTAEAAKRAALGAGARVLKTFCFELDRTDVKEIRELQPDIILLAGGTDGGNKSCIIHNARMISETIRDVPLVVAGNSKTRDSIADVLQEKGLFFRICENVMPRLNVLEVEPVRQSIKELFMERIVAAKGMKKVEEMTGHVLMPTPAAVLNASRLLADGFGGEEGIGEMLVIDIGGATTDVYSIAKGEPTRSGVLPKGLMEPYAKRSVEGDLGMRVSALSLWEAAVKGQSLPYTTNTCFDFAERCAFLSRQTEHLPQTPEEKEFDDILAAAAVRVAVGRHAGFIEQQYTPMGAYYFQTGKDLQEIPFMVGTGGVIVENEKPHRILRAALFEEGDSALKPRDPGFLVDKEYIMSALGLLAEREPQIAVKMLKKYIAGRG